MRKPSLQRLSSLYRLATRASIGVMGMLLSISPLTAQAPTAADDFFRQTGKFYTVAGVVFIIFLVFLTYLVWLDRRLRRLERRK